MPGNRSGQVSLQAASDNRYLRGRGLRRHPCASLGSGTWRSAGPTGYCGKPCRWKCDHGHGVRSQGARRWLHDPAVHQHACREHGAAARPSIRSIPRFHAGCLHVRRSSRPADARRRAKPEAQRSARVRESEPQGHFVRPWGRRFDESSVGRAVQAIHGHRRGQRRLQGQCARDDGSDRRPPRLLLFHRQRRTAQHQVRSPACLGCHLHTKGSHAAECADDG
jgi:hypothetical protein